MPSPIAPSVSIELPSADSQEPAIYAGDSFEFSDNVYANLVITTAGAVYRSVTSRTDSNIRAQVDAAIGRYALFARDSGQPAPKKPLEVDLSYLRAIRRRDGVTQTRAIDVDDRAAGGLNQQQHHFSEWVGEAVRIGCSDLEYEFDGNTGTLKAKWHGAMTKPIDIVNPREYAAGIMPGAWNLGRGTGDVGGYNPHLNQGRRIPGSVFQNIPKEITLDGIRLTFLRYNTEPNSGVMYARLFARSSNGFPSLPAQGWDPVAHIPMWVRIESLAGGMVIMTGEVGHGKTTTMATLLKNRYYRRGESDNIITIEDIVELPLPFAKQIQLPSSADGLSQDDRMDELLAWVHRANPSTLSVNEAKNTSTFRGIIRCVLNGTTTFTTGHTKCAHMAMYKLQELKGDIPTNLFDPEVIAALSGQRLSPVICPECAMKIQQAEKVVPYAKELFSRLKLAYRNPIDGSIKLPHQDEILDRVRFANPEGCSECVPRLTSSWAPSLSGHMSGTSGRTVIGEVVLTNHTMMSFLQANDTPAARKNWIDEGGNPMQRHALLKIAQGIVDPREIEKLFSDVDRFHELTDGV